MSSRGNCPVCGKEMAPEAPAGLCTKCVFKQMLAPAEIPAASASKPSFPRPFGDYELLAEIARGGMGVVYQARQVALNRLVAVKVIVAGELASPDFAKRFRMEAEAAAGLDHPNIVPIYEIGEWDGQPFFSMRLIEGPTLWQRAEGVQSMEDCRRVATVVATLARAVHHAHQRGIIHRDIKPNNVLLDAKGEPHLTDFGLAKLVEKDSAITKTMAVLGTPSYMAPEQARGETKSLTTAADVYGLGAVFYELLTGRPPFAGGTTMETIRQVLEREPRRPTMLNPKVDRDLEIVCLKCLEKEPNRRYGSAEALAADLERWLKNEPITARAASRLHRLGKWARRHPAVAFLLGGLVVSVSLGFALTLWQSAARQRALEEGRHLIYAARIGLVEQAWAGGHVNRARELLESLKPRAGQQDLRGFEWRYLSRICRDESLFTLADEQNPLQCIAASSDGRLLALVGGRPYVSLWEVSSRRVAARLPAGSGNCSVAFSPDNKLVAAAGQDASIRIWEVNEQRELCTLRGHTHPVRQIAFSPDGKWLASASRPDGVIKLWDVGSRMEKASFHGPANDLPAVAFSPDSAILAWSAGDQSIRLMRVDTGEQLGLLARHSGLVDYVAFSPDGKWLASGSKDATAILWDVKSHRDVAIFSGHGALVTSVAFSPDNQLLTSTCADGTIKLWNLKTKAEITTYKGHEMWVNNAVFLPDGQTLASAGEDGKLKLWEVLRKRQSLTVDLHRSSTSAMADGPEQEVAEDETFFRQDACGVAFSVDGARVMVVDDRPVIQVWDANFQQALATLTLPDASAAATGLFADGRSAVSAGLDRKIRLWNLDGETTPLVVGEVDGQIARLAVSSDGRSVALSSGIGRVVVFDTAGWKPVATNICGRGQITALAFVTGTHALLAAVKIAAGTNELWRVDSPGGVARVGPEQHQGMVTALAVSPDGRLVAGSSRDGIVRLWQAQSLKRAGTFRGHSGYVTSAAFSPDGRTLATASNDGMVKLWSVDGRQELLTMSWHIAPWTQLAFSPDGNTLVGSGGDGMVRVWRAGGAEE